MITKIKQVFKERWKFYLIGYAIGYLIPIIIDRKVNIYYLFPFKLMGVACALGIGTALFYGLKKMPVFEIFYRSIKYASFIVILDILFLLIKIIIICLTGFDITPYIYISNHI